jgi:hypothetical protein
MPVWRFSFSISKRISVGAALRDSKKMSTSTKKSRSRRENAVNEAPTGRRQRPQCKLLQMTMKLTAGVSF